MRSKHKLRPPVVGLHVDDRLVQHRANLFGDVDREGGSSEDLVSLLGRRRERQPDTCRTAYKARPSSVIKPSLRPSAKKMGGSAIGDLEHRYLLAFLGRRGRRQTRRPSDGVDGYGMPRLAAPLWRSSNGSDTFCSGLGSPCCGVAGPASDDCGGRPGLRTLTTAARGFGRLGRSVPTPAAGPGRV